MSSVAVVIPWRDGGCPHRRGNARYVVDYYQGLQLGEVLVVDDGRTAGPFSRSAAYNRGYAQTTADVVVWNEADTLIPHRQLEQAIEAATAALGLVVPFTARHELSVGDTTAVLTGGADPFALTGQTVFPDRASFGQCGVTSRATMTEIGGRWDQGFSGWGYDDNGMMLVFRVLAGEPRWVDGPGMHLWHPHALTDPDPEQRAAIAANEARWVQMMNVTDAATLRAMIV
jgi:hypothetical protein